MIGLKKLIISVLCFILISLLGTLYAFAGNTVYYDIGKKVQEHKNDPDRAKIVAKIDGKEISKQYFDNIKTSFENNRPGEKITDDQVLNEIATKEALLAEANKLGLTVSREETIKNMADIRKQFEDSPDARQQLENYIDGTGMTEDQYWASEDTINTYQKAFTIAKLKNEILKNVDPDQKVKQWDDYNKSLKNKVKVEKVNN